MPVMTKSPKGDDIVILSRKEYDRLLVAANDDERPHEGLQHGGQVAPLVIFHRCPKDTLPPTMCTRL